MFTDLDTVTFLEIGDVRRGKTANTWMSQRPDHKKRKILHRTMNMSTEFRKAIGDYLPTAQASVDHFHILQRCNQTLTSVS